MKVDVINMEGIKVRTINLPEKIFEAAINVDLMHQAFLRQMAHARLGTHKTKTRAEVSGGGRKPWRQKGTGRARQGSIRAPQWVGGGRVHTPQPRKYISKMTKMMRRAALRSALSAKAKSKDIVVLDKLFIDEPKTKLMEQTLSRLVGDASVLLLIPDKNSETDDVLRASRNLPNVKSLSASYLNIRDLIGFDKLLIPVQALDVISAYLG